MTTRRRGTAVVAVLALLVLLTPVVVAGANSKASVSGAQHTGLTPNPDVVLSKIIYDDGDAKAFGPL